MMIKPVNRLDNAAAAWMSSADSLRALTFSGNPNSVSKEKQLKTNMLNSELEYNALSLQCDTAKRVRNANMKRNLDLFA